MDARQGRVSRGGHFRHHHPGGEAQLSGEGHQRAAADRPRGLSHRHHRPPRSGAHRRAEGYFSRPVLRRHEPDLRPPGLRSHHGFQDLPASHQASDRSNRQGQAPGDSSRARLHDRPRGQGAHASGGNAQLPRHLDASRQGRFPGKSPALARHARHARHRLRQQGDGRVRLADQCRLALRRPDHRPAVEILRHREHHPHRHRPCGNGQDGPCARRNRRRRQGRAH